VKRHFASALVAGLITGITFVAAHRAVVSRSIVWVIAGAPGIPGFLLASILGLGRGPDGFATQDDVAPYLLTFVLWWVIVYWAIGWRVRRAAPGR
jgi:hypothetical protein